MAMPHSSVAVLPSPEPCLCVSPICPGQEGASVCPQSSQPQTVPRESVSYVSSEPQAHKVGPQNCAQTHLATHCGWKPDTCTHSQRSHPCTSRRMHGPECVCNTQEGSTPQHQRDHVAQPPRLALQRGVSALSGCQSH